MRTRTRKMPYHKPGIPSPPEALVDEVDRSTSVLKCSSCSGQGTRLTPSGHRMICGGCDGTGIAKQEPECIYCGGSGRVQ